MSKEARESKEIKERALLEQIQENPQNNSAKEQLLKMYRPHLRKLARKYLPTYHPDFEDLLQEIELRAVRAMEKFDLSRGEPFKKYLFFWVKAANSKYQRGDIVSFSCKQRSIFPKINKAIFMGEIDGTDEEIDERFGKDMRLAYRARKPYNYECKPSRDDKSDGDPHSSAEQSNYILPHTESNHISACTAAEIREKFLEFERSRLKDVRWARAFQLRSGMNDKYEIVNKAMTNNEISELFKVSPESIRSWNKKFIQRFRKFVTLSDFV